MSSENPKFEWFCYAVKCCDCNILWYFFCTWTHTHPKQMHEQLNMNMNIGQPTTAFLWFENHMWTVVDFQLFNYLQLILCRYAGFFHVGVLVCIVWSVDPVRWECRNYWTWAYSISSFFSLIMSIAHNICKSVCNACLAFGPKVFFFSILLKRKLSLSYPSICSSLWLLLSLSNAFFTFFVYFTDFFYAFTWALNFQSELVNTEHFTAHTV